MVVTLAVGTLASCQTTPTITTPTITAPVMQVITANAWQAYNWQLVDVKRTNGEQVTPLFFNPQKPLTLNFLKANGSNRVTFINACNNMGADYSVVNSEVQLGNVGSTMMACPEPQARFDTATLATVQCDYTLSRNA